MKTTITHLSTISILFSLAAAWIPGEHREIFARDGENLFKRSVPISDSIYKVRCVNLGSLYVIEPWMVVKSWNSMGCGGTGSEFDCVKLLGQQRANVVFANHWSTFITQSDIQRMRSYGLNTIRIPLGYWIYEDLVDRDTEYFPQGGLGYLEQVCGWASDEGIYIILDLHGAPGAQLPYVSSTGQLSPQNFYNDNNYERALKFLEWAANLVHTNDNFRNVGMLGVANEPTRATVSSQAESLRTKYYPQAFQRIRDAETKLQIQPNKYLHVQMMDKLWGSGDPNQALNDTSYAAYDSHIYLMFSNTPVDKDTYIKASCNEDSSENQPTIVGEFSLGVPQQFTSTQEWTSKNPNNTEFYQTWFAAQISEYEKHLGWCFWSWKTELDDYRWSYDEAVQAGVIPMDIDTAIQMDVCAAYT
jgi:aryl-phospho-beta-D-glucosidase BglC (GH1 family)